MKLGAGSICFLAALGLSAPAYAQGAGSLWGPGGHMWGDGQWMGGLGMGLMMLFWVILIGAAILGGIWIARRAIGDQSRSSAQDILRERLARGEIDVTEYEERRKTLEK